MAYKAQDGRTFNSANIGKQYDKKFQKKAEPMAEHSEHENAGGSQDNIHDVVAEHGKAHKIEIHHDHEAGKHHIISHHENGHIHQGKEHDSAEEAHAEAKGAAGIEGEEPEADPAHEEAAGEDYSAMGL